MLPVAQQCDGLEPGRTLACLHAAHRGRGRVPHPEDGSATPTDLAPETKRVEAHILVCFQAFVLWKTLAQLCQRAGLGNEPRKVFQELEDITLVDVVLPTRNGMTIRKRCISRPTEHQAILLQHLNLHLPNSLEMARV